jgi:hypothetical protein
MKKLSDSLHRPSGFFLGNTDSIIEKQEYAHAGLGQLGERTHEKRRREGPRKKGNIAKVR